VTGLVHAHTLATLVLGVSLAAPQTAPPGDPLSVARLIQQRYDTIADFSADFVHAYEGGVLRKTATERGTMAVKKPARMRWAYESPEKKLFVADGFRIYSYIPEDRQVLISPVPAEDDATTPALFLSGKGNLARDFTAAFPLVPDALPGTVTLTLTPKRPEPEYAQLTLVVDRGTWRIRKLITADAQGGLSTFTFTNVRENTGLSDKEFRFTIPKGVDVVTTNGQARD
jgi:outer membrane lipoprotein carrier protein